MSSDPARQKAAETQLGTIGLGNPVRSTVHDGYLHCGPHGAGHSERPDAPGAG